MQISTPISILALALGLPRTSTGLAITGAQLSARCDMGCVVGPCFDICNNAMLEKKYVGVQCGPDADYQLQRNSCATCLAHHGIGEEAIDFLPKC